MQLNPPMAEEIHLRWMKSLRDEILLRRVKNAKRKKENEVNITRLSNKSYRLDITLNSGLDNNGEKDKLMELSLYVTDSLQAESLKNSFINNPSKVYEKVIEALTEECEFKE